MDDLIPASPEPLSTEDQALISLSRAQVALDNCKNVMEAKQIADVAEAARVYLQRTHQSLETVNRATEIRILAERQMGVFLKEMPKAKGGATYHKKNLTPLGTPGVKTLAQIGISEMAAEQAQKLGDILELDMKGRIAETKAKGEKLSVAKVLAVPKPTPRAVTPLPDIVTELIDAAKATKGDAAQRDAAIRKAMLRVLSNHLPNWVGAISDRPATPEDVYAAYPRHEARPVGLKAINNAMVRHKWTADALLEITLVYAGAVAKWGDARFTKEGTDTCPHPSTFFNQDRFLDDPKVWQKGAAANVTPKKKGQHDLG